MVRYLALGNGSLLVNIDQWLQTRDIYFPHIGQENHLLGHAHKIGIFFDDRLSWLNDSEWERSLSYRKDTLVSDTKASNNVFDIAINDCVHFKENIFLKKIIVKNNSDSDKDVKLFFYHDFHLYGDGIGDTAAYDPSINAVFHYKRNRYFLINSMFKKSITEKDKYGDLTEFNVGEADGHTIQDASNGMLDKNPIAQGEVDSIFSVETVVKSKKSVVLYYWIACGRNYNEVAKLNLFILKKTPENLIKETDFYWKKWLKKTRIDFKKLDKGIVDLFNRSLLIIKTQIDKHGAIIAANDSDNQQFNKDTYSYLWPRDGALAAMALQKAGFFEEVKPFYRFCSEVLTERGFLLHKYNPDKSLGSSWHPYFENGKAQLPIQEDETALVIIALWSHYQHSKDKRFLKEFYPVIKRMAGFLMNYRYKNSKLPRESYDLWEERRGILCFTCNTVCGGLECASLIARALDDNKNFKKYHQAHEEVHKAVENNFFSKKHNCFLRMINFKGKEIIEDATVESSLYSNFYFCGFDVDDDRIKNTMEKIRRTLWIKTDIGGLARYKYDQYHNQSEDWDKIPGNPWFICTLWLAKYYIRIKNFSEALKLINWVKGHALSTGILSEQIHPYDGRALSVSPLTWSHAEFVETVCDLQEARK